ncbi:MAG: aspartate 1-decarboxylase [Betaproteobacteria bacterium TMED156]|nr:MAG: aspartate 1-decarboxylase [Betaproteobacteria bacterium TMED156]
MKKIILSAKIHRAVITDNDLHYEGSCAIDGTLLEAAGMSTFEKIEVYNINTGERFETYIIEAPNNSGIVALNGAAARKAVKGDLVIICSYAMMDSSEIAGHEPKIVLVDEKNCILK